MSILQETCYPWKDTKIGLILPRLFNPTWYLLWVWNPIFSHCGSTYLSL